MINFLLNKNEPQKIKEKRKIIEVNINPIGTNINYEKLTEAIVKASIILKEQQEEEQKEIQQQQQKKWESIIIGKRYSGENYFIKILDFLSIPFRIIKNIIFFRRQNVMDSNVTFSLLKICNELLLDFYQLLLLVGTFIFTSIFFNCSEISWAIIFPKWCYLTFAFLFFLLSRIVRIVTFEAQKTYDRDIIVTIFNAITSFTAMIVSVIAVIIALIIGK